MKTDNLFERSEFHQRTVRGTGLLRAYTTDFRGRIARGEIWYQIDAVSREVTFIISISARGPRWRIR